MATSAKSTPEPRLEHPSAGWIALKFPVGDEFSFIGLRLYLSAVLLSSGGFQVADCEVSHRRRAAVFASLPTLQSLDRVLFANREERALIVIAC